MENLKLIEAAARSDQMISEQIWIKIIIWAEYLYAIKAFYFPHNICSVELSALQQLLNVLSLNPQAFLCILVESETTRPRSSLSVWFCWLSCACAVSC